MKMYLDLLFRFKILLVLCCSVFVPLAHSDPTFQDHLKIVGKVVYRGTIPSASEMQRTEAVAIKSRDGKTYMVPSKYVRDVLTCEQHRTYDTCYIDFQIDRNRYHVPSGLIITIDAKVSDQGQIEEIYSLKKSGRTGPEGFRTTVNDSYHWIGKAFYNNSETKERQILCSVFLIEHGLAVTAKHCFFYRGLTEETAIEKTKLFELEFNRKRSKNPKLTIYSLGV